MRSVLVAALPFLLLACGDDGGGGGGNPDAASNVPAMITVSGKATKREGTNSSAAAGVVVSAYQSTDPNTPVATATTDAAGMYSMVITTNGKALDGFLKGTLTGFLDTYLYAPAPLDADFSSASINMINSNTLGLLSGTLCASAQDNAKGVIALIIADSSRVEVAGATASSAPAAAKVCYNQGGFPNKNATMTDTDGIAYLLNVTAGKVTVNAAGAGAPYHSHDVEARAGTFTTTVIQP
ncbi:MAG TPA: hypothetical protein VMZ53_28885 [Kofleriaceae bacterium]|nr:hypothetical protein [Kofleriaceae bacterium]